MKKIIILLFFVFFGFHNLIAQTPPTIQACGPEQQFCLSDVLFDLCVKITVTSGLPSPIDHFEIDWGDGTAIQTVPGGNNPANQTHQYDFNGFFGTCTYDKSHFVVLETYLQDGTVLNNSFRATFVNPPQAIFEIVPNTICEGDEICFRENSCPTKNLEIVSWDYGDGSPSGTDNCHTYSSAGTYTVTLDVKNPCGTDRTTMQLQVIKPPIADGIPEADGVVDNTTEPYIVCLGGGGKVTLNGDSLSQNETSYFWEVIGRRNDYIWNFEPMINQPIVPDQMITFRDTGIFNIILTVNNACGKEDKDTLTFRVLDAEALFLNSQADGCLELDYTPDPLNSGATYIVNGSPVPASDFPIKLGIGSHTVSANLTNECGPQSASDDFVITDKENVTILNPTQDTVCVGSDLILLLTDNNSSGNWNNSPYIVQMGDSTLFDPRVDGDYTLEYCRGTGDCQDCQQIAITVEGVAPTADDQQVCQTSDNFLLTASPSGGTWSSVDCPNCIRGDSFIVAEFLATGLSSIEVDYELTSAVGCSGAISITVNKADPVADFSFASDTVCAGTQPDIINNSVYDDFLWRIDGQDIGGSPPSFAGTGFHTYEFVAIIGKCRDSMSKRVFIIEAPDVGQVGFMADYPPGACAPLDVQLNNSNVNTDLDYEWFLNGMSFSTSPTPGMITLQQGLNDTIFQIRLEVGNQCGGAADSEDITVRPGPIPRFGFLQNTECSGDTVGISNVSFGNITDWLWDYGNGITSTDSLPLILQYFTDSLPTIYPISLIGTNDCGTDTFSLDLTIDPTDVKAFFNTDPVTGCVGTPIQLIDLSTLGSTVEVDFGDGNTALNPDTIFHTYADTGTYNISWKALGCGFDSIVRQVEIFDAPDLNVDVNEIICPNDTLFFDNQSTGASEFSWQFGDGDSSSINSPKHVYDTAGIYQVTMIGTSNEECTSSYSVDIEVLDLPIADFSVTDSVCVGQEIQFFNNSINSNTCNWDFGDGSGDNICNPIHSYSAEGSYIVTLNIEDAKGCKNSIQRLIFVYPNPQPNFDFLQPENCSPSVVQFENTSTIADSYFWEFGTGDTSRQNIPDYTFENGGIYTVTLTATKGLCSQKFTKDITVNQTPTPIISVTTEKGCAPFEVEFFNTTQGQNLSFEWNFADGTTSFENTPSHTFQTPDSLLVQVIAKSDFCVDTAFLPIIIFEPTEANLTQTDIRCFGDLTGTIDLEITSGTAPFQYQWSNGEVTDDLSQIGAGTYDLEITDQNGCLFFDTVEIFQPEAPLNFDLLKTDTVTCFGGSDGSIFLEASGGTSDYQYRWQSGSTLPQLTGVVSGNYALTITDANNCILETDVFVPQNDSIDFDKIIQDISCFGENDGRIILENFRGGKPRYSVLVPELDSMTGTQFNELFPGIYTVIVTDNLGCQKRFSAGISEPSEVWVEILQEKDTLINLGESLDLPTDYNFSNPIIEWIPDNWLTCNDCDFPIASPQDSVLYFVKMTDDNGCSASDSVYVRVHKERKIALPDAFSPNDDSRNDIFYPRGKNPGVKTVRFFRVFDRWGGLLFESKDFQLNDPTSGWDGTAKGEEIETGHYIYHIQVEYMDNWIVDFEGSVLLIK